MLRGDTGLLVGLVGLVALLGPDGSEIIPCVTLPQVDEESIERK